MRLAQRIRTLTTYILNMTLKTVALCLSAIHNGTLIAKIKSTVILSLLSTPLAILLKAAADWLEVNIVYITFISIAIITDHLIGVIVHLFIKKDFSILENIKGLAIKSFLVMAVAVLVEGMSHIIGNGFIVDYVSITFRLMVFLYPAGSAFMNCAVITDGKFPPIALINKIKNFNTDLNLKNLKGEAK